jgi:hypothetical protein
VKKTKHVFALRNLRKSFVLPKKEATVQDRKLHKMQAVEFVVVKLIKVENN